jgi:hypothetical protein
MSDARAAAQAAASVARGGRIAPVSVRLVILLCGVALTALPGSVSVVPAVITVVGTVLAVTAPRLAGSSVASAGFVLAWLSATGWHDTAPMGRTIAAAAVLYVLHVSAALAACVPMKARVEPGVIGRWVARCTVPVLAAAALIGLDYAVPRQRGTPLFELAGLVAVLCLTAAVAYALRRRALPLAKMAGRAHDT